MSESSPLDVISRDESSEDPLQSQTFTLSMKTGKPLDLPRFPVFEFYRIPQIGVYGPDYFPSPAYGVIEMEYKNTLELPAKLKHVVGSWNTRIADCFAIVHGAPRYAPCEKFTCDNSDEFNIMYHAWAFPSHGFDDELVSTTNMEAGCFDPVGVRGVHLNLVDGGMAINEVKNDYTVLIHGMAFSPANLMLQTTFETEIASFFTAAYGANCEGIRKTVVCYHIVPTSVQMESKVAEAIAKAKNLESLVAALKEVDTDSTHRASNRLEALLLSSIEPAP